MDSYFQPDRLRLARELRGFSQAELAVRIGVSAPAVSQFENGYNSPGPDTLERIGMLLGCRTEFFFRRAAPKSSTEPFFRRRRNVPKRELLRASAYALLMQEVLALLEFYTELPPNQFVQRWEFSETTTGDELEAAAAALRSEWDVPSGPIANMVRLAESKGAAVTAVGAFDPAIDAFSLVGTARPFIVLCSDQGSAARRRFDTAHEVAHLVGHAPDSRLTGLKEQQAHRFAAALLMPADQIEPWLPRAANQIGLLEEASLMWGVSMQAVLVRARTLGLVSESAYRSTFTRISRSGWRTREPVDLGPPEAPLMLARAAEVLPDAGCSLGQIANRIGLPENRLLRMLSIPEDHFDRTAGELIALTSASVRHPQ